MFGRIEEVVMKLTQALRTPYRARNIVRAGPTAGMDEASIDRGVVLTQLALLALCAARAGADVVDRVRTIEGGLAFALAAILSMSLAVRIVRQAARGPTRGRRLPRDPSHWTFELRDVRAG
jgi:hypothetical protein